MENREFDPGALLLARRRKNLTQEDCAKELGKHRYTLIRIEQGRIGDISEQTILAYADFLGVPHEDIFKTAETPESFFASKCT